MKKVAIVVGSIVVIMVLLAGMFSAGLIVGNFFIPKGTDIAQPILDLPILTKPEVHEPKVEEPTPSNDSILETETEEPDPDSQGDTTTDLPPTTETLSIEIPPPAVDLGDLFIPFWETWDIVHEYYVDQPLDDEALMQGAIQGMITTLEVPTHTLNAEILGIEPYVTSGGTPEGLESIFTPFWTNWALTKMVDDEILVQGAISGMLDSLGDPHTSYMNPQDYQESITQFEGEEEYEGIGAWVDISKDYLTIITPFPDSPAEAAGLQPGDKIISINGEDMTGIDGELVRQKVLGPAGTKVTFTILREGIQDFDVVITRGSIIVPSIEARMLDNDIAYLRLYLFGDKSDEEVREALEELLDNDPVGLIFDLRYNGGGGVDVAVSIASEFIDDGVIFYEVYGDGTRDTYEAEDKGLATDIPMVVLVNDGSASASEIVSGAIQDHGRAPLVGTTTFGKGSVQYWIPLSDDKGAVRVTIASWITPNERLIHQIGLEPDISIIGIAQSIIDEGYDTSVLDMDSEDIIILSEEEIQSGRDVQLEKAIEILLNEEQ